MRRVQIARLASDSLRRLAAACSIAALGISVAAVSPAGAAAASPAWSIRATSMPTNVSPAIGGNLVLLVTNPGAEATDGSTVTVTTALPAGLSVVSVTARKELGEQLVECTEAGATVRCTFEGVVAPDNTDGIVIDIRLATSLESGTVSTSETVTGGGAAEVSRETPVVVSSSPALFGITEFDFGVTNPNGIAETQAGGHPNALTVGLNLNSVPVRNSVLQMHDSEPPKSISVQLPTGMIGNPQAAERCPEADLVANEGGFGCPRGSVVGTIAFTGESPGYLLSVPGEPLPQVSPLYNVAPQAGYPAEFAFDFLGQAAFIYAQVAHTSAGYVVRAITPAVPLAAGFKGVQITFFGDPAEHDGGLTAPKAFFSNPVNCAGPPPQATLEVGSTTEPGRTVSATSTMPAVTGCERLHFEPQLKVQPDTTQPDAPTGLQVHLHLPQNEESTGLASAELKDAIIRLPEGVSLSPAAANGLRGCPASGSEGIDLYAEEVGVDSAAHLSPGNCPEASELGAVEVETPVLTTPLKGHVYLAEPKCGAEGQPECTESSAVNGELYGLYLEVAGSGVVIKLAGRVAADPSTGQISTTFENNPQLPFSDLRLTLKGGPHAPLATPQICGTFTATSDLAPWSSPSTKDATPAFPFSISGCPAQTPFTPSFSAGSALPTAGGSSAFSLTFARTPGQQDFSGVSLAAPPGLTGMVSQVPQCQEPAAGAGQCSEASQIGTTSVSVGSGSDPYWVKGKVYLTGPYGGAPFGLSIVVPAKAGPFNLGNVVVRATININPVTTALTVTSGPLPQIRDGVPFRIQTVNVTIDRPGFMRNPTNCSPMTIAAAITAAQGAAASVSNPFAVSGCNALPFKPVLSASTRGSTSKANGASLDVKVGYPVGAQANIKSVKVDLPLQLPSRLSTLHKACLAAVFAANPALCPPESAVGMAKATTPVLGVPLVGPAYFVSHGGAAFPDLVVVLQGDGVTVELTGKTLIRKGITSSTFAVVPDVPVSGFELYLPQSKFSALAANGNLCKSQAKLKMPTRIVGQNGAVISQTTSIKVTGCPKASSSRKHPKTSKGSKAKHKV